MPCLYAVVPSPFLSLTSYNPNRPCSNSHLTRTISKKAAASLRLFKGTRTCFVRPPAVSMMALFMRDGTKPASSKTGCRVFTPTKIVPRNPAGKSWTWNNYRLALGLSR